mgnify:CR=1 FL=1
MAKRKKRKDKDKKKFEYSNELIGLLELIAFALIVARLSYSAESIFSKG